MAPRTRQCPRTLGAVYEPEHPNDEPDERPAYDWDAWEKNRFRGRNRWWLILMVLLVAAMTVRFFQSGGEAIPWGPPG